MGFHMQLLISTLFSINIHSVIPYTTNHANNIHDAIFSATYKKKVLPAYPTTIKSEYNLLSINFLDMKSQTLSTSGWFTVEWTDPRLTWDNATNGNIDHIYAPQSTIWHPQIIAQNSVEDFTGLSDDSNHDNQLKIRYDGHVRWEPPAVISTSCDIDVTYFPYDRQKCDIKLASWGFHNDAVNLTFLEQNINRDNCVENGEWDLDDTKQYDTTVKDGGFEYAELVFEIHLHRRPGHFIMSVLFPTILIAVLTTATFMIPVESGEKVTYMLPVLLALVVLLTLFDGNMPTTSKKTSLLVVFVTATLALASLAIVLTIAILWLHHKPEDYNAPACLHKMVSCLRTKRCRANNIEDKADSKDDNTCTAKDDSKRLSNQELAESIDRFLFGIFTVVYIGVVLCFTITLAVGGRYQSS